MDDMLQYDDARRYIKMMQRRIFGSVEQCVVLLNLTAQQRVDDTDDRSAATRMLQQSPAKCDGIPGLVSLLTSALSLIATFA